MSTTTSTATVNTQPSPRLWSTASISLAVQTECVRQRPRPPRAGWHEGWNPQNVCGAAGEVLIVRDQGQLAAHSRKALRQSDVALLQVVRGEGRRMADDRGRGLSHGEAAQKVHSSIQIQAARGQVGTQIAAEGILVRQAR